MAFFMFVIIAVGVSAVVEFNKSNGKFFKKGTTMFFRDEDLKNSAAC